jgi:mxaD protein
VPTQHGTSVWIDVVQQNHPHTEIVIVKIVRSLVFAALVATPGLGFAAAPVLKVSKSVIIHAAPATVWVKIKNFTGLDTWHPVVSKDELVAGSNNEIGAERTLTLRTGGGTAHEKLLGFDARHHRFKYTILESVLPVSSYTSTLSVKAAGKNRSKVTWSGTFKRKNTGPNPAANENDAAATVAMNGFYQIGLDNLKKIIVTE